jgi:hypothetical protein
MNCGGIDIRNDYNCCDLDLHWKNYNTRTISQKQVESRVDYLNRILGQNKTLATYELERANCGPMTKGSYCKTVFSYDCSSSTRFEAIKSAYSFIYNPTNGLLNSSFEINWKVNDPNLINLVNLINLPRFSLNPPLKPEELIDIFSNERCDKFSCEAIRHYLNKYTNAGNPAHFPPSQYNALLEYLEAKTKISKKILMLNCIYAMLPGLLHPL